MQLVLEMGWELAEPVVDDSPWDMLINRADAWEKVQVKRCYPKHGCLTFNLVRNTGMRYEKTDADWLAAVEVETGRVWMIPFGEIAQYTRKRITADMAGYELGRTAQEEDHE